MHLSRSWALALLAPLLPACTSKTACDDSETLVDGECVAASECPAVSGATLSVAPGTNTLGTALADAVSGDVIALTDGTYVEEDTLLVPAGVTIAGACPDRVTVRSGSADPGFEVADADGVHLAGFTLVGGAPGIALTSGTPITVTVDAVSIRSAGSYGVYVAGSVTLVATGLDVADTLIGGDGTLGRGLSAQSGAAVTLSGSRFERTAEVAVFADGASLDLSEVTVLDTQPNAAGFYGRGIHLQRGSDLTGTGLVVDGNREHGISLLDSSATVSASSVTGTQTAPLADGSGEAGDGIGVFLGADATTATATVTITTTSLTDNARAGLLADATPVTVDGCTFGGNVYSWVSQNGAALAGTESSTVDGAETALEGLVGADVLSIYDEPME